MKKAKIIAAVAIVLSAAVLMGCSPRNAMSTLSTESDSETAEVFSLTKVLDLGTNYLVSLDYENAILQYIDIIQHDPKNKEAYAGLYAAYAAQGKTDEANEVLNKAQEVFEDDAEFLPEFLKDADLIYKNGGGNGPFQVLSDQYWNDVDSLFAENVSHAWLEAEPDNAEPYALLGAYYSAQDDKNGIIELLKKAEENGVDFNAINQKVEVNSDGSCTLTVQIENFMQEENGKNSSVKVELDSKDDAKTATQKVAEKVADSAASKVVKDSGLTGEAANIANSMAQEALKKGLGSTGSTPGTSSSSSSSAAPAYDPAQDDGTDEEFDWSEIESEFPAFSDDLIITMSASGPLIWGVDTAGSIRWAKAEWAHFTVRTKIVWTWMLLSSV